MLRPEEEAKLDPLAELFRSAFQDRFAHLRYEEEFTDRLTVTIPAVHPETGEIVVWIDGDEVTVGIGRYFHTHFEAYVGSEPPEEEDRRWATEHALAFIDDFMTERTFLRVYMKDGKFTGSSIIPVDRPEVARSTLFSLLWGNNRGRRQTIDYLWSGPKAQRE